MNAKPRDYGYVPTVRVHIDRLDHADQAVWGVSMRMRDGRTFYTRAHGVQIDRPAFSAFRPGARQPKAWLELAGNVERRLLDDGKFVQVVIR